MQILYYNYNYNVNIMEVEAPICHIYFSEPWIALISTRFFCLFQEDYATIQHSDIYVTITAGQSQIHHKDT